MRLYLGPVIAWLTLISIAELSADPVRSVRVVLPPRAGSVAQRAGQIFSRQINEWCDARVVTSGDATLSVELAVEPGIGTEGYRIADGPNGSVRIIGNDDRGLLYGVGKFLRASRYDRSGFTAGTWRGTSVPVLPMRGIYLSTHFNNFYEAAPIEKVQHYIDDLALWGTNSVILHFPFWQFQGFDDPAAQRAIKHLKGILRTAKAAGMRVGLVETVNGGFASVPKELRGVPMNGLTNFGVNLCPNHPKARELILANWTRLMDEFADVGLDYIICWPYDEGGCGCQKCRPWGASGFPRLCRAVAPVARAKFPKIQFIISTWFFDAAAIGNRWIVDSRGEWEGLAKFLAEDKSWADYILADSGADFPRYPLERGVPGGLPLLNFPEISMWGQDLWGGYGANPFPNRLQRLWNQTEKEYIAFEYSPAVVHEVSKVIGILEQNQIRKQIAPSAEEAFTLVQQADAKLLPQARGSWRWRIVYLRAKIDRELLHIGGQLEGDALKVAFDELTRIYHAENAISLARPPQIRSSEE